MKKILLMMSMLIAGISVSAQHVGSEYRLKKVIPVAGRQGITMYLIQRFSISMTRMVIL